jgi:hypothetical protein
VDDKELAYAQAADLRAVDIALLAIKTVTPKYNGVINKDEHAGVIVILERWRERLNEAND